MHIPTCSAPRKRTAPGAAGAKRYRDLQFWLFGFAGRGARRRAAAAASQPPRAAAFFCIREADSPFAFGKITYLGFFYYYYFFHA